MRTENTEKSGPFANDCFNVCPRLCTLNLFHTFRILRDRIRVHVKNRISRKHEKKLLFEFSCRGNEQPESTAFLERRGDSFKLVYFENGFLRHCELSSSCRK